jgi:hypothetical protein
MAFSILAEALARVEHKLDVLLRALGQDNSFQPMHFTGQVCPICKATIDYIIDIQNNVVVRRCSCKSGKMSSIIPLQPTADIKGVNNAPSTGTSSSYPSDGE